jgi:hypothetical protein
MAMEALAPFANYACPPGSGLCACHNCTARAALSAARSVLDSPAAAVPNLHAQIMNIRAGVPPVPDADNLPGSAEVLWAQGYKVGHRDARHAAAELVSAAIAGEKGGA